ncbi:hypothetical protein AOLI_G00054850 [Acnodon oligacanthus]
MCLPQGPDEDDGMSLHMSKGRDEEPGTVLPSANWVAKDTVEGNHEVCAKVCGGTIIKLLLPHWDARVRAHLSTRKMMYAAFALLGPKLPESFYHAVIQTGADSNSGPRLEGQRLSG